MRARAFMRDWRGLQGENEGKVFLHFLLNQGAARADLQSMGKNTISAGFILLSLGDVVALSQFSLSLWEAVAFGALGVISYGMGLFAGLAE